MESKDFHWQIGGGRNFLPLCEQEKKGRNSVYFEGVCTVFISLPSARAQLCTTVFPDGEDAGRRRAGPPGATKPSE